MPLPLLHAPARCLRPALLCLGLLWLWPTIALLTITPARVCACVAIIQPDTNAPAASNTDEPTPAHPDISINPASTTTTLSTATNAKKPRDALPPWPVRILRVFGRLHPVVVHLPIALLLTAALFEILSLLLGRTKTTPNAAALACLVLAAAGAVTAAWFGWLNADFEHHGKSVAFTLSLHRWLGITTAALATVAAFSGLIGWLTSRTHPPARTSPATAVYRITLVLAAMTVAITGHLGGTLVYGSSYFTEVLFPKPHHPRPPQLPQPPQPPHAQQSQAGTPNAADTTAPTDPTDPTTQDDLDDALRDFLGQPGAEQSSASSTIDFVSQVAPIFIHHCLKCHGPSKHKGDLRLDDPYSVFDRDIDDEIIVPGDARASDLYWRLTLPPDDEDAMPPEDKADPLDETQKDIIRQWIEQGAYWPDDLVLSPED